MTVHGLVPAGTGPLCAAKARRGSPGRAAARRAALALVAFATASCIAGTAATAGAASSTTSLDAATKRALDLQERVESLQAEQASIQLRLDETASRLRAQNQAVAAAQAEEVRAQGALHGRAVAMYKSSDVDAVALLVGSASWGDLVTRASLITRMLDTDSRTLQDAEKAAEAARRASEALTRIQRENAALRDLQSRRVAGARAALAEQKRLVATLSEAARRQLAARKASGSATQRKWAGSSVGSSIPKVPVTVDPYSGTFLAADYAPKHFRATGQTFSGLASWYGKAVDGHKTASGRRFNYQDFTCAHRSLPFGTWLAVTRGDRRIIVMVTDRGPYVSGRVLDLSEAAAKALDIGGVKSVNAEVVVPQ